MAYPSSELYAWDDASTYVKLPPAFEGMSSEPPKIKDMHDARVLAILGDSVTTDHISPAGSIQKDSPAGTYLMAHAVATKAFNSSGSRRGNHEVMMRGTFANIRLRNLMAPGTEGGWTRLSADTEPGTIYDAALSDKDTGTPLRSLAGKD